MTFVVNVLLFHVLPWKNSLKKFTVPCCKLWFKIGQNLEAVRCHGKICIEFQPQNDNQEIYYIWNLHRCPWMKINIKRCTKNYSKNFLEAKKIRSWLEVKTNSYSIIIISHSDLSMLKKMSKYIFIFGRIISQTNFIETEKMRLKKQQKN